MKLLLRQVKQSWSFLDASDKWYLSWTILLQSILALFDLLGAAGLGLIGLIAAVNVTGSQPPNSIYTLLEVLGLSQLRVDQQLSILGAGTIFLFITKTLCSLYLNKLILHFLSRKQTAIASDLWKKVLESDYLTVMKYSRQDLIQGITDSLFFSIIVILGNFMLVISELILLLFLLILLSVVYPLMAFLTLCTFGSLAFFTQKSVGRMTREMNIAYDVASVKSKTIMTDSLSVLPEIRILGKEQFFIKEFTSNRKVAAESYVKSLWLSQVPKYVLEIGLILSGLIIFFFTQLTSTPLEAFGRIAVFLAVSGRLVPSLLRLQSGVIGMHAATGNSHFVNQLRDKIAMINSHSRVVNPDDLSMNYKNYSGGPIDIRFEDVEFQYGKSKQVFQFGDLVIKSGKSVAITGKSGVGKSTLVQLVLGLIEPSAGNVTINHEAPSTWVRNNPGSVSYLPQSTNLISGTIAENIALGVASQALDVIKLNFAITTASLNSWVESLPDGVNTKLDPGGLNVSGGQIQRIGIARALYSTPGLLILDEPTSSLDNETEKAFLDLLGKLRGKTTIIVVTHRLVALQYTDSNINLEGSSIVVSKNHDKNLPNSQNGLA